MRKWNVVLGTPAGDALLRALSAKMADMWEVEDPEEAEGLQVLPEYILKLLETTYDRAALESELADVLEEDMLRPVLDW